MAYNYLQDMPKQGSMDSFIGGYDIGLQRKKNQAIDNDNKALADILRGDTNAITRLQSPELIQKAQNHLRELEQRKALQGFYTPATKDQYQANVTQNPIAAIMDGGKKPSNLVQAQQPSYQESQAPTMLDMLQTGKIASGKPASYDVEGAGNYLLGQGNFDQLGKLTDYRKAIGKDANDFYGGLTEGVDPKTGQPVLLAMTKKGAVPSGYAPKPKDAQAPKARVTWNVGKGRSEETWGYDAKGNEVLLGVKSLDAPQSPVVTKADPVAQALAIAEGKDEIKRKSEQRAKVAEKYADSEAIEPILKQLITQLGKIPKTGFTRDIQSMVEYFGAGDEEAQNAIAEVVNTSALLVPFAQKQSGPQSDKDVQQYKEQVAAASNPLASASSRMAAAKNALMFAQRVKSKFGSYASDILSGKVTPEELQEKTTNPTQPPKPKAADRLNDLKEYRANRARYAKDPTALRILDDQARADGLIK